MNERSSAETMETITRLIEDQSGSFALVREATTGTWTAIISRAGYETRVGVSTESPSKAVDRLLNKINAPRIPEFSLSHLRCTNCGHDGLLIDQGGYCNAMILDSEGSGDTCSCKCVFNG